MAEPSEESGADTTRAGAHPTSAMRPDVMWPVGEAKARFSEVIERSQHGGPQTIAKRGTPVAVVVSIDEWKRKTKRTGTLAEFFAAIRPDDGEGIAIPEIDWSPRPVECD